MHLKKFPVILFLILFFVGTANAATCPFIEQFGITWTFAEPYPECGKFVNEDNWVVGPVTLDSISPEPSSGRNGFTINPRTGPKVNTHSYDSRAAGYDASLQPILPALININSSIVSTISREEGVSAPFLQTAAVLTVLDAPPPAGSFRPPYTGTDKPLYSSLNLRRELLLSLPPVSETPTLSAVERMFERPWIDHQHAWSGHNIHPEDNMTPYGAGIVRNVGIGALRLLLDEPIEEKETLLIRYVQLGIDLHGLYENGQYWPADGGHASGRKFPVLFAGLMLDDPDMKNIGFDLNSIPIGNAFGEDCQTYYDDDESYAFYYGILGMPRWGGGHCRNQNGAAENDESSSYRTCCGSKSWIGQVLAARLLKLEELWNHQALFDYEDRWMAEGIEGGWGSRFADNMWETYRSTIDTCNNGVWDRCSTLCDSSQGTMLGEEGIDCGGNCPNNCSECTTASNCDDTYQCKTLLDCVDQQCVYSNKIGTCNDGDACTTEDTCTSGRCEGTQKNCDDPFPCTTDSCSGGNCQNIPNNSLCGTSTTCTTYTCNTSTGCQTSYNTGAICNDDIECTTTDVCNISGTCQGTTQDSLCPGYDGCTNKTCTQTGCVYTPTGCAIPPDLVLDMSFDGDMQDSSGNNNHGTCTNCPTLTEDREGNANSAYDFDGSNDFIDIEDNTSLDITDEITIAAWIKPDTAGQAAASRIISKRNTSGGSDVYALGLYSNVENPFIRLITSTGRIDLVANGIAPTGQWTHIAATYDGSNAKIYINGIEDKSAAKTGSIETSTINLHIGDRTNQASSRRFNGSVDEVKIYDRALTSQEILALFNEAGQECVGTPALLGYISQWKQGSLGMTSLMQKLELWKAGTGC